MSANQRKQKKVIFFDLHGTLIPKNTTPANVFAKVLQPYTARWQSEEKSRLIKKACKIYSHALVKYKRKSPVITSNMRTAAIKRAIAILPLPDDDAMIASLERDVLLLQQTSEQENRRAIRVLQSLKKHYEFAVISNGTETAIRNKLRRYKLNSVISGQAVFASSKLGRAYSKPHPAIFRHALTQMGITARQAIVIGDSWQHDVAGAAHSGIDAIWLNPADLPLPQQFSKVRVRSVRNLSELTQILL